MFRKQQMTIQLPDELLTAIKELAVADDRSINKTIEMLLRARLAIRALEEVKDKVLEARP